MNNLIVKINEISVGYDSNIVLKNTSLDIFDDDFIGIIGPNGGGKTTLLKAILGLLKPVKGSISYYNDVTPNHSIGYLPQRNQIDSKFPITVLDVVLSGLMSNKNLFNRYNTIDKEKAYDALEKTGMLELKKEHVGSLSGGQLQRILLSRALISNPKLLILDEPDTFVDNSFEGELYEMLKEMNKSMTILMVSHDLGMISSYVKTIACVNQEVHYHKSNKISQDQLASYDCPIQLITHGHVPHTVLHKHD